MKSFKKRPQGFCNQKSTLNFQESTLALRFYRFIVFMHEILPHLFCKLFYEVAFILVLVEVTGQVSMSRLTSPPEPLLECESRGANYFPRSKNINLYNKCVFQLYSSKFQKGGGELKTPKFPPLTMARFSYLGGMRLMCVQQVPIQRQPASDIPYVCRGLLEAHTTTTSMQQYKLPGGPCLPGFASQHFGP